MAEVQTTDDNVSATGQQHTEQPESNNEGEVDQNADQCYDTCPLPAKLTDNTTIELSNQLLESENVCNEAKVKNDIDVIETINIELEHSVAKLLAENEQLHKEKEHLKQTYKDLFDSIKRTRVQTKDQNDSLMAQLNKKSNENADVLAQIQKKGFAIAALKNELRKLTGNSVNTKFAKPSILGKPVGQPLKNQSVVRQPTAFKSERPRISKPRFASQVDVNNDLSKPVTTHHLPKGRESAPAKPHHMIAPSSSRYSSNDIVHNHYLEEAKKKTHEHSRIPRNFSDSKHFVCSTCQKCVFNANHDACVIKFLKEVNSRAKVPSNKTTNRNKPVEQIRVATKPKRQIPKGHRFSIKKTTTMHEKTTSPRSCLRWQPTGRILKTVCLRWVPTGKTFASSTTKVESEPPNGSNADIPNQCESEQALNVSAGTLLSTADQASVFMAMTFEQRSSSLVLHQMMSDHNSSDLAPQRQEMSVENVSSGLVHKLLSRVLHNIIEIFAKHLVDTNVFTMKMKSCLIQASKQALGSSKGGVESQQIRSTTVSLGDAAEDVGIMRPKNKIVEVLEFVARKEEIELPRELAERIDVKSKNNLRQAIRSFEATCQHNPLLDGERLILTGCENDIADMALNIVEKSKAQTGKDLERFDDDERKKLNNHFMSIEGIMEIEPDIENMTLNKYLEYEAETERRLWRNVRSKSSPTRYERAEINSSHRDKSVPFDFLYYYEDAFVDKYYALPPLIPCFPPSQPHNERGYEIPNTSKNWTLIA
ncbi:hypothetical protein Tco_0821725 [Tanacetum coccineum]|uniref:Uncharacterized protein n=1 Tax=Tanacetum coccineum TaxID=301880 RepID=A0ABQ5AHA1_9ASTR